MRNKWYLFMFIVFCLACSEKGTEKHQNKRDYNTPHLSTIGNGFLV